MTFSLPYSLEPDTHEHLPELCNYRLVDVDGCWRLENRAVHRRQQLFSALVFHGGPGSSLEMRLFSRNDPIREFADAGFAGRAHCRPTAAGLRYCVAGTMVGSDGAYATTLDR